MKKSLLAKTVVLGLMTATIWSFAGVASAAEIYDEKFDVVEASIEDYEVKDPTIKHDREIFGKVSEMHPGNDSACELTAGFLSVGQIAEIKDVLVENDKKLETKANAAQKTANDAKDVAKAAKEKADKAQKTAETAIDKADKAQKTADEAKKKINEEATTRAEEDAKLQANIDKEATTRAEEDAKLDTKIDAETKRATREEQRIEEKFDKEVSRLDSKIDKLDGRIEKVGAMSAAIANLHTMGYDPAAPTEIAVGVGQYRDKTGLAVGAFHYPNRDFMMSFSVSTAGDEFMAGIGATWKIGRKSPEQMLKAQQEKAARERLAEAEAMKKAAKDARVAAQQARHAKMLAERSK